MSDRYLHIDIAAAQSPKHSGRACGDVFWSERSVGGTVVVLADGLGSDALAHIAAEMCASRFAELLRLGYSFHQAFESTALAMEKVREPGKPYSAFTALRVRSDGQVTVLCYETPPPLFVGAQAAYQLASRPRVIGERMAVEAEGYVEPGESLLIMSDGVTQAGLGDGLGLGWGIEGVSQFVREWLRLKQRREDLPLRVHDHARSLCRVFHDDCTVIAANCRIGRIVSILTGPPGEEGADADVVSRFWNLPGTKVVCGGTTAEIVAREMNSPLKMDLRTQSLIAPPRYSIPGIELVCEGAVTLNQVYNVLEEPLKLLERDTSVTDMVRLLSDADRVNIFVGASKNEAHGNIAFRQRGVLTRDRIVPLLAEKLRLEGKLVVVEEV